LHCRTRLLAETRAIAAGHWRSARDTLTLAAAERGIVPIEVPPIRWPAVFTESGPAEDPAIVLAGRAEIAGVGFTITALRMRAGFRAPDYRPDVPERIYESTMAEMVDDIEDLTESIEPERIVINGAQYLLWMVPMARP
jgi:hypothetical protein